MFRWKSIFLIADDFISLIFPRSCQACGKSLVRNENLVCTECLVDIPKTNFHLMRDNILEKGFYGRCYIEKAAAWSYYRQGSKIQKIIHNLKYKGIKPLGPYLGRMYGLALKESDFCDDIDIIIPVPLHKTRRRKRGFNQTELIARGLSEAIGLPVIDDVLIRHKASVTQTSKQRYDRWTNVESIFALNEHTVIEDKHILLLDDVITTGSTIEACASELLRIKGVKVSVAAIAAAER